ncbi:MAG: hypothetical protein IPM52_11510 [Bacteroidetes bacterium]|nr:hypothetical protein [Bacteroidota bacterium]
MLFRAGRSKFRLLIILLFAVVQLSGQKNPEPDALMRETERRYINDIVLLANTIQTRYASPADRFRAAFSWTAQNLRYDVAALHDQKLYSNQELVRMALRKRAALCEGYVAVLDSLSRLMGLTTIKVPGYTRWQGKLQPEPHLWIAVLLDSNWYLSDPTWASGAIVNGKYQAEYDTLWFMVPPQRMIHSHMPYDPIWQLLQEPLSHEGFVRNTNARLPGIWHPNDSIAVYLNSDPLDQYTSELRRIRQGQFRHPATQSRISFLEESVRVLTHNRIVGSMQQSNELFNAAVATYNEAVEAYNKRKPRAQVIPLLLRSSQLLTSARLLMPAGPLPASLRNEAQMLQKHLAQLESLLDEAQRKWY